MVHREKGDRIDREVWRARADAFRHITCAVLDAESRNKLLHKIATYEQRAVDTRRERDAREISKPTEVGPSTGGRGRHPRARRNRDNATPLDGDDRPTNRQTAERLPSVRNRLLQRLPIPELERLIACAERVPLTPRQILHHWNMPLREVYFIEEGLVSVSVKISRERDVEAWLIGSEGMSGIPVLFGDHENPPFRRVVQVGGSAWRISADDLTAAARELKTLGTLLQRYASFVLCEASHCGACNAQHTVKQRMGRWLLTACDGLESNRLPATHELLARLLGVRRASVSECLIKLEAEGAIFHTRRLIEVLAPEILRSISCDCHSIVQRDYRRLFASPSLQVRAAALA